MKNTETATNTGKYDRQKAVNYAVMSIESKTDAEPVKETETATNTGKYDRQKAVNYAVAHGSTLKGLSVPGSWYYMPRGVDCTNFVSQSLYAGGWIQRGAEWMPAYQWYYKGVAPYDHSISWTSVTEFGSFVVTSGRGRELAFTKNDILTRPAKFDIGDIIQGDWEGDGVWDHSMIITKIDNKDVYVTYHSLNKINTRMSWIVDKHPEGKFRVFVLKNSYELTGQRVSDYGNIA